MNAETGIHIFGFITCLADTLIHMIFIRSLQDSEYYDFLSVFDSECSFTLVSKDI